MWNVLHIQGSETVKKYSCIRLYYAEDKLEAMDTQTENCYNKSMQQH